MLKRRTEESDRAAVGLDRRSGWRQLVAHSAEVQQYQLARRCAEVLHPGHRFLTAVAPLLQVYGRTDPADLVRDRAMVGLETEPRMPRLDAQRLERPIAGGFRPGAHEAGEY